MRLRTLFASFAILIFSTSVAFADTKFNQVKPSEFDPGKTFLVQAAWLDGIGCPTDATIDRKSTRLNSSHLGISYAVFCLKKKKKCEENEKQDPEPTHQRPEKKTCYPIKQHKQENNSHK